MSTGFFLIKNSNLTVDTPITNRYCKLSSFQKVEKLAMSARLSFASYWFDEVCLDAYRDPSSPGSLS